ncbi:MAG: hypothetical protein PUD79_04790 [Prevotellaceae bacterium]|nr:hypothetical protein [Prevotellaceae bacterium]
MDKYKYKLLCILMVLTISLSSFTCSDDNEDNDTEQGDNNGGNNNDNDDNNNGDKDDDNDDNNIVKSDIYYPLFNECHMLLTEANITGHYGEEQNKYDYDVRIRPYRCTQVEDYNYESEEFYIDYNKRKMNWDGWDNLDISFNSKGYITKINGSWNVTEDGDKYYGYVQFSFNYDGEGHMLSANGKWSENEDSKYGNYVENCEATTSFVWKNGNMISSNHNGIYYETNKSKPTEKYQETQNVTYGTEKNTYKQQFCLLEEPLAYVGLFGLGTNNLPNKIIIDGTSKEDNFEDKEHYVLKASFSKGFEGQIYRESWETEEGDVYLEAEYTYSNININLLKSNITEPIFSTESSIEKTKRIVERLKKLSFAPRKRNTTKNN